MKLTIFAKKRATKEGKPFYTYLTRLTRKKDGTQECVQCKFADDLKPSPTECPLNIEVERDMMNLSKKNVETEKGIIESKTLWIKEYDVSEESYLDTSMDEYM